VADLILTTLPGYCLVILLHRIARRQQLQGSTSPGERESSKIRNVYERRAAQCAPGGGFCPSCWCRVERCACIEPPPEVAAAVPHRVLIYCHYKEYMKLSNTGALLLSALPPGQARLYVCGIPEQDEEMMGELETCQDSSFVLYPSKNSQTFEDLAASLRRHSHPRRRLLDPRTWFPFFRRKSMRNHAEADKPWTGEQDGPAPPQPGAWV
jgi:hypothetical protein